MSNTSRLIDKLIEKKLVEREICPDNRRKIEIFITNRGLNLLNDLDNKSQMTEAEILKPLSIDDQKILRNLINKITLNN
jgi:DNA-binding MarR family transcriptional regulator